MAKLSSMFDHCFAVGGAALLLLGSASTGCKSDDNANADGGTETATESGGTSGGTVDDGTGGTAGTDTLGEEFEPAPGGMRRLLVHEYQRSVELMFGPAAAEAATPPNDTAQEGWDAVGNAVLSLDPVSVTQIEASAMAVADATIADPNTLAGHVPCVTDGPFDATCYQSVAEVVGRMAYRRSLTGAETTQLTDIGTTGMEWANTEPTLSDQAFLQGVKYQILAMLQAPSFIYLVEVGEPDDQSGFRRLTSTELAARMSFFIMGRTPDTELLDLAEGGGLETEADIRAAAETLIETAQARVAMNSFFDELLRLRFVEGTLKDTDLYPMFTPELAEAMRQESLLLMNDIVWQSDADYRNMLTADYTFINDDLAAVYDMPAPGMGATFVKVDWPAEQNRAGFLSQASFLTVHSHPDINSPTKRGKYVNLAMLCSPIPPPPPDVMAELPEPMEGQTLREALLQHKNDPACSSCHDPMDEIGFAFEFFGPIGEYRTLDNGQPIIAAGELDGLGTWANAAELGQVIKDDPRTPRCLIHNLIRGELGRKEYSGEFDQIDLVLEDFEAQGYSMKSLMVEMASSPIFRYVNEPK